MGFGQYSNNGVNASEQSREASELIARLAINDTQRETVRRQSYGTHANACHVWAQNKVAAGKSSDGRIFFANGVIYSHGQHFPIARFLNQTFDGRPVVLFNADRYSISTSQHQSHAKSALSDQTIVISVPKLANWPGDVASVRDDLIDRVALTREECESADEWERDYARKQINQDETRLAAFAALYPQAGGIPPDLSAYIEARDAARTIAKAEQKRADELDVLRRYAREIPRYDLSTLETPDSEWNANNAAREAERILQYASRALITFNKAIKAGLTELALYSGHAATPFDGKALATRAKAIKKESATRIVAMKTLAAELAATANVRARVRELEQLASPPNPDHVHYFTGETVQRALTDAAKLAPALVPALLQQAAQIHLMHEIDLAFEAQNPDASAIVRRRQLDARRAREASRQIDPIKWQLGEGNASQSFDRVLVRRKGDNLETSMGAVAPFGESVTAFRAAQACRFTGKGFRKNGERLPVGHFEVDSIDTQGNLVAGCHTIRFPDMLALAIREVPRAVKTRYPAPAIVRG